MTQQTNGVIIHEWLEPHGGAERVVDAMRAIFPSAALYALWNDAPTQYPDAHESWLARTPLRHHKALALPALPLTWRHFVPAQSQAEWALVSSHLFAHQVDVRNTQGERLPKFVYAHTPARYLWEPQLDARGQSPLVRSAAAFFKPLDRRRAHEATAVAANSEFVRDRIRRTWEVDATVIYPPVNIERIQSVPRWSETLSEPDRRILEALPDNFILGASRFVPYKRLNWVILAGEAADIPVVIAGSGPEEQHLRSIASNIRVPVHFVPRPSTELLYALYQAANVYVFPAIEDFGIMPVEAQAAGAVVVTTSLGGAKETLPANGASIAAAEDTPESVAYAVCQALERSDAPQADSVHSHDLQRFSQQVFTDALGRWMNR